MRRIAVPVLLSFAVVSLVVACGGSPADSGSDGQQVIALAQGELTPSDGPMMPDAAAPPDAGSPDAALPPPAPPSCGQLYTNFCTGCCAASIAFTAFSGVQVTEQCAFSALNNAQCHLQANLPCGCSPNAPNGFYNQY